MATAGFSSEHMKYGRRVAKELKTMSKRDDAAQLGYLSSQLQQLGFDSQNQTFRVHPRLPKTSTNLISILRAPRGEGVEAMVITFHMYTASSPTTAGLCFALLSRL